MGAFVHWISQKASLGISGVNTRGHSYAEECDAMMVWIRNLEMCALVEGEEETIDGIDSGEITERYLLHGSETIAEERGILPCTAAAPQRPDVLTAAHVLVPKSRLTSSLRPAGPVRHMCVFQA